MPVNRTEYQREAVDDHCRAVGEADASMASGRFATDFFLAHWKPTK